MIHSSIKEGWVFIAMPMAGGKPEYDDVHDAVKQAASDTGLTAERIDEIQHNERITDTLLQSIRDAEFVVADLTDSRPNVFYEAGYAFGLGKTPIYIARAGTNLEFDLKDYPVIFFQNFRELKVKLQSRFEALIRSRGNVPGALRPEKTEIIQIAKPKKPTDPIKVCPICEGELKVTSERPHPHLGTFGTKVHDMSCVECGHKTDKIFRQNTGYR